MLRTLCLILIKFNLILLLINGSHLSAQERPNIIFFLVDDMGWQDTSVPFGKEITAQNKQFQTPNMERLASMGTKFINAYATPVCTPTRVSLMTGMNVVSHRVTNWTSPHPDSNTSHPDSLLDDPDWNINGFSNEPSIPQTIYATPLPELLTEAGYYTIHCGKAHFGSQDYPGSDPLNLGFQVNIAGNMTGHPQSFLAEKNYGNIPGETTIHAVPGLEKYYGSDVFLTEALTREALSALQKPLHEKKPFFLYMSHYAVHLPFDPDSRYYQSYLDRGLTPSEAAYSALIEGMDKSLGDLIDFLEDLKILDNTIIIFISDNGGYSFSSYRMGADHTQNLPLKAGKGSVYEGGIREPMLLFWKNHSRPNTVSSYPIIIEDFFPTILAMAGINDYKTIQKIDGGDFSDKIFLKGNRSKPLVWHYPNRWGLSGPGISFFSAIRKGKWKLVYNHKTEKYLLFDLDNDIGEENNIATDYPSRAKSMAKDLTHYLRSRNAQMPYNKVLDRPVLWPSEASPELE